MGVFNTKFQMVIFGHGHNYVHCWIIHHRPTEPQRNWYRCIQVYICNKLPAVTLYAQEEGTMRPKDREMTQHGGPPGWLKESDIAGWDLCCTGRTDRTACHGLELLSCELLAVPGCIADILVRNVHKTLSWGLSRKGMGQSLVRSLKWLAISTVSAETLHYKLLSTRAAGIKELYFKW